MRVRNATTRDIGIQPGLTVPAGAEEEIADFLCNLPSIAFLIESGALVAVADDETGADGVTREDIAKMGKDEIEELMLAHGVDIDKRRGVKALRELAEQTIFVDL